MERQNELRAIAVEILEQSKALLNSLPKDSFTKESTFVPKSNVAKHVRHLADHFRLLLANKPEGTSCVSNGHAAWTVDYDARDRNVPMETDVEVAIKEIEKLQSKLLNSDISLETPVHLLAIVNSTDDSRSEFPSNYGRELWFCIHHAVHHHALIKVICIEHKIEVPEEFGVAPATQNYNQKH
ncbi:hypothetical protein K493DRAFT_226913 [Basidiobolus meristosporus CBS 931.73]|uniref:DinB-like domain-containing protein n=1 Tax=Basidiobolus meristosporus CBS 931.73 TaxID=1314790 RepID=A0A1Y1Y2F0_9FUNG|nr:hypothetical protein K493DRAFT_226913 [Basidiobolus meristosporus CBS 931.73]|eukprot:ORX91896.1 hypothetical protein K493DRAFT_226913 [Basidiobolus meristosporus CBS 931.73]